MNLKRIYKLQKVETRHNGTHKGDFQEQDYSGSYAYA